MRKKAKIKSHGISLDVIEKSWDLQATKIPGFYIPGYFRNLNSGIFGPRIFQSWNYPGISHAHLYIKGAFYFSAINLNKFVLSRTHLIT